LENTLLPRLEPATLASNIEHLTNVDADLQLPSEYNFSFYSTHDFHTSNYIKECMNRKSFPILNCNIRSLSANFDALVNLISELYFPFSVIGMSETKIKVDHDLITNVDIPGYNFISQPSLSNAGGVGFFLRDHLKFKIRSHLPSTTGDFESLWVEIMNNHERNIYVVSFTGILAPILIILWIT
jgi:hypothetical protein